MPFFQFNSPTRLIYNEGMSKDFAHELELMGVSRLFVITDAMLVKLGLCAPILKHLKDNGITITGVFDDVPPDSSVATITAGARTAKETDPQGFLAIGGGSVIDTAKGVNLLATLGGDLKQDYAGAQNINQKLMPLIVIPTTAGTGSEVTEAMVIHDTEAHTKLSFVDSHLTPTLAVLDPELTVGLPPMLTAATGLDALTHAMESIMSVQNNPASDALALRAITLIQEHLATAVADGANMTARGALLTAATLAGMAFNNAMVGVVHAVAHSIGAIARVHHGTANGVFLPFGLEYNLGGATERIALMAPAFGLSRGADEATATAVISAVRALIAKLNVLCGFPLTLKDAGVKEDQLATLAALAVDDGASFYNPRPVTAEDVLEVLQRAY